MIMVIFIDLIYFSSGGRSAPEQHGGVPQPLVRGGGAGAGQAEGGGEEKGRTHPRAGGLHRQPAGPSHGGDAEHPEDAIRAQEKSGQDHQEVDVQLGVVSFKTVEKKRLTVIS